MIGTEIGRFRLEKLLGEGGMGQVYLGVQPAIGSRVAIKILSDQCARMPELLERFFAEAKAVNLVRHENIVSVLDLAQLPDGRPYIVMEFIEGQTLGGVLRTARPPLGGIVQVMSEVLSALAAAHHLGIVHRDLKPDNIIVTGEGHAKVLDFGIAKLAPGLSNVQSPRTATGALLGTPAYMAPEQISGAGNVDPRADIYAAGVVLFEAVCGQVPFQGSTLYDLMHAHLSVEPPRPTSLRPDLPRAIEDVILQALQKDPKNRFQSANAMAQALQQAGAQLAPDQWRALSKGGMITNRAPSTQDPGAQYATTTAQAPPTVATKRKGKIVAALAGIAVITGVVLLLVARRSADDGTGMTPPPESPETPLPSETKHELPPPPPDPDEADGPQGGLAPIPGGAGGGGGGAVIRIVPQAGKQVTKPADYNPKKFDPVAYLPKAIALAKSLIPDAELTSFEFDPVRSDGSLDLTMEGRDREYEFRSPSASVLPKGHPKNLPLDRPCRISIEVGASEIEARVIEDDECNAKLVRMPKCSFAAVWAKAKAEGVDPEMVARIGWLFDEQWFFDTDFVGEGGGVKSFVDDCR